VATARQLGPALDVQGALGEAARRNSTDIFGEQRHSDGPVDVVRSVSTTGHAPSA